MNKFKVYCNPEEMEELCALSPFNLKKDLKNLKKDIKDFDDEELNRILEEIANELYYGINRPPSSVALYWHLSRKAAYAKIKTVDIVRDSGKSNGYRCIVLIDVIHYSAFVLHLYRHSHGEKDNISHAEQNQMKKLVDEYVESLKQLE